MVIAVILCLSSLNYASAQSLEKITVDISETQFIPISATTNNLDVLINYTTIDPVMSGSTINAVMHVFAPDGTQIKTLSFPDGFSITESGTIFMSTKFTDEPTSPLIINVTLTDVAKTETISNTDSATVPFDDEQGQERLRDKFDRTIEEILEKQQDGDNNDREVERIETTSQSDLYISSATPYFEGDYFHIVGEVHNTSSDEKEFVKVIATFYDEDNNVIGTDNRYTNPSTIQPQDSSPFEFMIGQGDVSDLDKIKSYKIIASDE